MASGDVVNTAARLQSAAPVDGVLVGEGTYRASDRAIRYERAEPVQAKGNAPGVVAEGARAIVADDETDATLGLVGRAHERGLLWVRLSGRAASARCSR
jgi:hypothetical protein